MIYLIVWFFFISFRSICFMPHMGLWIALSLCHCFNQTNCLYLIFSMPIFSHFRVIKLIESMMQSIRLNRHICFDVFLFVFLPHTTPLSIFFRLNAAILHPINCIGEHILFGFGSLECQNGKVFYGIEM